MNCLKEPLTYEEKLDADSISFWDRILRCVDFTAFIAGLGAFLALLCLTSGAEIWHLLLHP